MKQDLMEYKNYYAQIYFSAEDDLFYGKVIGLNDLISFEGASVKELKKGFKEAVEDYLTACEEVGKAPEKAYKGSFNIRVPLELHRDSAVLASLKKITLNEFVKNALMATVANEKQLAGL